MILCNSQQFYFDATKCTIQRNYRHLLCQAFDESNWVRVRTVNLIFHFKSKMKNGKTSASNSIFHFSSQIENRKWNIDSGATRFSIFHFKSKIENRVAPLSIFHFRFSIMNEIVTAVYSVSCGLSALRSNIFDECELRWKPCYGKPPEPKNEKKCQFSQNYKQHRKSKTWSTPTR